MILPKNKYIDENDRARQRIQLKCSCSTVV